MHNKDWDDLCLSGFDNVYVSLDCKRIKYKYLSMVCMFCKEKAVYELFDEISEERLEKNRNMNRIEIHKDENNKPTLYIDHEKYFISISHSYEYVGIMFSKTHEIGFDIEKIDDRIHRVSHKFLNENEQKFAESKLSKTLIWSAKESVYKWYGKKELDFKDNMEMIEFKENTEGEFLSILNKNGVKKELVMQYFLIENYVFTYCFE
jgi:phosphopantetheinyl transferase (holo-ACP synthase)